MHLICKVSKQVVFDLHGEIRNYGNMIRYRVIVIILLEWNGMREKQHMGLISDMGLNYVSTRTVID